MPVAHTVKINNSSDFCFMEGNVLITDHNGIFIKQTSLDLTNKSDNAYININQCFNIDCKMTTLMSKKIVETNKQLTKN